MPKAQPTLSSVLQLAHEVAKRQASSPNLANAQAPQVQEAIRLIWGVLRNKLSLQDKTTGDLDRLITEITTPGTKTKVKGASNA
jgi:hypothetical protein